MSHNITNRAKPAARTLLKRIYANKENGSKLLENSKNLVKPNVIKNLYGMARMLNPDFIRPTVPVRGETQSQQKRSFLTFGNSMVNNRDDLFQLKKRSLFIQTESTPNPESVKFIPSGQPVLGDSDENKGFYATKNDKDEIARSPLMKQIFAVEGVKSIYLGNDFVTVTKYAENHWMHLQTEIFSAIMDHYASGKPVLTDTPEITDTTILEDDDEVVALIKELLEQRIRPAVQEDGGDIRYVGFDETTGVVQVSLAGSCVGCPSSLGTLKNGVENMLMHYIPEVKLVEAIDNESDEENGGILVEKTEQKKNKTYEERLAAAGIPFSD